MPAFAAQPPVANPGQGGKKRSKSRPPATVGNYAPFNLPRKLTFGSRLDIKLRWIEMIRRVGRALLPGLQNRFGHKRTILQGKGKRGGGVQNLLAAL